MYVHFFFKFFFYEESSNFRALEDIIQLYCCAFPPSYSHPPPNFSSSSFHIPLWPLESPCYVVNDQSTHNIERLRCFSLKKKNQTKKKNNSYLSVFSLKWERKGHLIVKGMCALSSDNLRGILHKQINVRPTSCFWHHLLVINIKWETISSPGGVVPTHKSVSSRITFKKKKRERMLVLAPYSPPPVDEDPWIMKSHH